MTQSWMSWVGKLGIASWLAIGGAIASFGNAASAQIILDSTLGSQNSRVTPASPTVDQINGGATKGANLFHSFQEFNVGNGRSVYFSNPVGIENILTRVTGTNPSNIFGKLGVLGNANLFLLNPNGIIFGPNATLDVRGSFVATTANGIRLANGDTFSANKNDPLPNELLNVNPSAFFFNQMAASSITSEASLQVPDGKSLLLVGGNVQLNGGQLLALGGRVELGGVAGTGTVGLSVNSSELRLSFPEGVQRADVSLTGAAKVNVSASGGGSIAINARNIDISGKSRLIAGIRQSLGSAGSQAGDITLNATGGITIRDGSGKNNESTIVNQVDEQALGNAGSIILQANESIQLTDSQIDSVVNDRAVGNGGNIIMQARSISLTDTAQYNNARTRISTTVKGQGNAGNIVLNAESLSLSNARIAATTGGNGNAGNVDIKVDGSIEVLKGRILGDVVDRGRGNGGNINIQAGSLFLDGGSDGGRLSTNLLGQGKAGSISVRVKDTVTLVNSGIISSEVVGDKAIGNGGEIAIEARSLSMENGGRVQTRTYSKGRAGNIQVIASDSVVISGNYNYTTSAGLYASTEAGASDQGGNINVKTNFLSLSGNAVLNARSRSDYKGGDITLNVNTLQLTGGAQLLSTAFGNGNAGDIAVNAKQRVTLSGSDPTYFNRLNQLDRQQRDARGLVANDTLRSGMLARTLGTGKGGEITITTGQLTVREGAVLTSDSTGRGSAGNLKIKAGQLTVENNAQVSGSTSQASTGSGGNITLNVGQLNVRDGAEVNVSTEGSGNAGNLRVSGRSIFLDNGGKLRASTASGEGGNINLQVQDLILMRRNSLISAEAGNNGNGGNITINSPFIVAVPKENSDIVANASRGRGGNINITTSGIYGLEYRQKLTPFSSDINASSDFGVNGTVQISTLGIDPCRGANLPAQPIDASRQIVQNCRRGGAVAGQHSSFVVTGSGGLPPNPKEMLDGDALFSDWVTLNLQGENRSRPTVSTKQTSATRGPIVEAQGWVLNDRGQVVLVAHAPTVTPHSSWQKPTDCSALNSANAR